MESKSDSSIKRSRLEVLTQDVLVMVLLNISSRHLSFYRRLLNVKQTHQSRTNYILLAELNGLQHTDVIKARSIGTWQICHRHVNIFGEIMEETKRNCLRRQKSRPGFRDWLRPPSEEETLGRFRDRSVI